MRSFTQALFAAMAVGLLTACTGAGLLSPTPATPSYARVKPNQTMSLPCHCTKGVSQNAE